MQRGFFLSLDLIITIVLVVFLIGILGLLVHNNVSDFTKYKEDAKMQATMNIVLNRLALSEFSCDLIDNDKSNNFIKKIGFCIPENKNISSLFSDLDYGVSVQCMNPQKDCFGTSFNSAEKYIAKDVFLWALQTDEVTKKEYFLCTEGQCDINKQVRVYVFSK